MSRRLSPLPATGPTPPEGREARLAMGADVRGEGRVEGRVFVPPGLRQAPVLDLMCSHFVLTLAARQGPRFNVRRDLNTLLSLAGRHLVWPHTVLGRLREFLHRRCKDNELWLGHEALPISAFMERYGIWRGPYEEGTLFFYLDEYAKESPKDLLSVLGVTGDWLAQAATDRRRDRNRPAGAWRPQVQMRAGVTRAVRAMHVCARLHSGVSPSAK